MIFVSELFFMLLIVSLLPYIFIPILIRKKQVFPVRPRVRSISSEFLPKHVLKHFNKIENEVLACGLKAKGYFFTQEFGEDIKVFMDFFVDESLRSTSLATCIIANDSQEILRNFFEINSYEKLGVEISTHNSSLGSAPIQDNSKIVYSFPPQSKLKKLLFFHGAVVKEKGLKVKNFALPFANDEASFISDSIARDLKRQESLGCLMLDENKEQFRPTWAGAFIMAWYSMWPMKHLRSYWVKIRAKKLFLRS